MRDMIKGNLRYSVNGTSAIKVRAAAVYDFPTVPTTTPEESRFSHNLNDNLEHSAADYRWFQSGSTRGIPLSGVTLAQKVLSGILATTLTAAVILINTLL